MASISRLRSDVVAIILTPSLDRPDAVARDCDAVSRVLRYLKGSPRKEYIFSDVPKAAIKIATNPIFHERTKHLEIDLHFGLDKLQHEKLVLKLGLFDCFQAEIKGGFISSMEAGWHVVKSSGTEGVKR
ncbi:hypothetical protein Tco_1077970 [Tanacetum coccineum]